MDRHLAVYNLLHAALDVCHISIQHLPAYLQFAVIAIAHRSLDAKRGNVIQVLHSLGKHEKQGTAIDTSARRRMHVQKLHILGIVETVIQSLHLIVDTGTHRTILHVLSRLSIHFMQSTAHRHAYRLSVVTASYLHIAHICFVYFLYNKHVICIALLTVNCFVDECKDNAF